jgi:hypothetical protein
MKKLNWLMAAMMVAVLSLVACQDDPTDNPTPPNNDDPTTPTTELTFEASVGSVTRTSAFINVLPSDLEADYLLVVYGAAAVEQCATDAEIITKIYGELATYAESTGKSFAEYMSEAVKRGEVKNHEVGGLVQNTNYYLLVFGVDAEAEYAATTEITMKKFKTEDVQQSSCTFSLKYSVNQTTASISVTPSDDNQKWHLVNVAVPELQKYTSKEGEYGWTLEEFFQNHFNTEIETLEGEGMSYSDISTKLVHTGYRTLNASGLQAKSNYSALVAGVSYDEQGVALVTNVKEMRYYTGEAAASNLTFDVEVTNVANYSADIRIEPSDKNAEYYYYISYIDSPKKSMKPIDIANDAVTNYIYYWDNNKLKRRDAVKGVVGLKDFALDIAETEYYVVAFSFEPNPNYGKIVNEETNEYDSNPGTITSVPVYVSFKTLNHGDPMAVEFKFSASDVGPYDLNLEIKSSDSSVFYQPGLAYAEGFDPEAAMAASAGSLAQIMQMCMEGQSPCLTFQEAFDKLKKQGYPYRNGNAKFYVANLAPEKEIIGYVLAIDMKTGKFAKCYYSDVIAKTTSKGTITPTVEVLGIFNGDEENGTIFGDASLTAGRPIVVVNHKNVDGASALFTALTTESTAEINSYSDQYIISEYLKSQYGTWNEVENIAVPYYFFVATWDVEQNVISYAQDANGHEGGVSRLAVTPVEYNEDLSVLKGYVDAVNNATAKALPQSLVVSEPTAEPTIECIWSQEVEPISGFEVTYHEVDFDVATVDSDLVEVKVVKSFAF